jgi:N-acetylated-alpha-linked acidic dipeptidase
MNKVVLLFICLISLFAMPIIAQEITEVKGFPVYRISTQLHVEQNLVNSHFPETYRRHLEELTRVPNIAGTYENSIIIDYMSDVMQLAGLKVDHYDYDVWLAEPGEVRISIESPVQIVLPNKENVLDEDPFTADERLHHGWNAYSGSGDVTAEVVYANYGRREDFQKLADMGIDLTGKIVIARYGGNFRGFKARYAEAAGAAGLIIYTDPANGGFVNGPVYPEGRYSNESTIQRGSLLTMDYFGDPLTPFEPALPLNAEETVERLDLSEVDFHTIPVAPIGYGAAEQILSRMTEQSVPEEWQGGLPFTYHLMGDADLKVRLFVNQPQGFKRITNVIGTIQGSVYPDEWIVLGSHFDAWGFGATDPNSGTAMLLTLAESLGQMVKNGYRPKRSIMIAHWDAEEFLIIGSTEWVEELRNDLMSNAVIYLNADMSVTGPNFGSSASPSLKSPIIEATKVVPHPDIDGTVYQQWYGDSELPEPGIGNLGGGSDHVPFYMHAGVPSASISISGSVPIYHSNYDTFHFYETFIDSDFKYGPTLASVYGVLALRFAEADILPYDLTRYGTDLRHHLNNIGVIATERNVEIVLDELYSGVDQLIETARLAEIRLNTLVQTGGLNHEALGNINKELIALEKSFLHEDGMPFGRWFQSIYASSDPFSGYASWMLPGLRYAIEETLSAEELWNEKNRLLDAIQTLIQKIESL